MFVLPGGVQQYSIGIPERAYVLGENPLSVGSSSMVGDSLMSYVLGTINTSGHIRLLDRNTTVHRETRSIHTTGESCYSRLATAKSNFLKVKTIHKELRLVLSLDKQGGVDGIWVEPDKANLLRERLRIWSGCYGAWPVHFFNPERKRG